MYAARMNRFFGISVFALAVVFGGAGCGPGESSNDSGTSSAECFVAARGYWSASDGSDPRTAALRRLLDVCPDWRTKQIASAEANVNQDEPVSDQEASYNAALQNPDYLGTDAEFDAGTATFVEYDEERRQEDCNDAGDSDRTTYALCLDVPVGGPSSSDFE